MKEKYKTIMKLDGVLFNGFGTLTETLEALNKFNELGFSIDNISISTYETDLSVQDLVKIKIDESLSNMVEWSFSQSISSLVAMLEGATKVAQRASTVLRYKTSAYLESDIEKINEAISQVESLNKTMKQIQESYTECYDIQQKM